jgi:hypothetical protein
MFNILKNVYNSKQNSNSPHCENGEEEIQTINLTYTRVPLTAELRRRQVEEKLREQYEVPKEKDGTLL